MLEWLIECETMPPELGMNELINSWEDWVPIPLPPEYFAMPVFTPTEVVLLSIVSAAIGEFCGVTPQSIDDDTSAIMLPQWAMVIKTAKPALAAMLERGKMPEDEELCFQ